MSKKHHILTKSILASCLDSAFKADFGEALKCGEFISPSDFVLKNAESYRRAYRSGMVRDAKRWARQLIWPNNDDPRAHVFDPQPEASAENRET